MNRGSEFEILRYFRDTDLLLTTAADWGMRLVVTLVVFAGVSLLLRVAMRVLDALARIPGGYGAKLFSNGTRSALLSVAKSILKYAVYIVTTLLVLNKVYQVETAALITASGIVGLAIGFGTQGLVRDFVTGLLILMERAYAPGDVVTIAGQTGIVEEISGRATILQDVQGERYLIPNGNVVNIVNYSNKGQVAHVHIFLPEHVDADAVKTKLVRLLETLHQSTGFIRQDWLIDRIEVPETGTAILRIRVVVDPLRRGLVDSMLVPMLRDVLDRHEIPPFKDRIVVYYATPDEDGTEKRPEWPKLWSGWMGRFGRTEKGQEKQATP